LLCRCSGAFDDGFVGLGAVAPLTSAVRVANIMEISVLARRLEIGLRRTQLVVCNAGGLRGVPVRDVVKSG
jgi:hypothetical protein